MLSDYWIREGVNRVGDVQYGPNEVPYVAFLENTTDEAGNFAREPVYDVIDQEELERRNTALDVRSQVNDMIEEQFGDVPIHTTFTTVDGSPTEFGVEVEVEADADYDLQEVEDELPTELEGITDGKVQAERQDIPVIVGEVDSDKFCSYQEKLYDPVPGGQIIQGEGAGTATLAFVHPDYGEGLAASGHVLGSDGTSVHQFNSTEGANLIGKAREVTNTQYRDCGFVEMPYEEVSIDYITTSDNEGYWEKVDGLVTDESLNNKAGTGATIQMQGKESCRKSGTLDKTKGPGSSTEMVVVGDLMEDGDSGSPMFIEQDGGYILWEV